MASTKEKTTKKQRTEQEVVAEIYRLTEELQNDYARRKVRQAVQDIRDHWNGKDVSF